MTGDEAGREMIGKTLKSKIEEHINLLHHKDVHENFEYWCREWAIEKTDLPKDEISGLVIGGSGEIGVDSYIIHRSSKLRL